MASTLDIQTTLTRVICSPDGSVGAPGRTIARGVEPQVVRTTSEPLTFLYGGVRLFEMSGWNLEKRDVMVYTAPKEHSKVIVQKTVDGERTVAQNAELVKIGEAYQGHASFSLPDGYHIFGLGQHEDGTFDYRGKKEYLVQNNMKIPMPVFVCVGNGTCFAIIFDAGCLMTFEEAGGTARVSFDAVRAIDYYVVACGSMDGIVLGLRQLTGDAVMLPRWAHGYIQSKERYKTQTEVLEAADMFVERGIPVSCIVQDWNTWEKGKWGNKIPDPALFPDPKAMISRLHTNRIAYMLSIWPNPAINSEDNTELAEAGGLLANATTYNAFDEKAAHIYWKQSERIWFGAGVDAWWSDSTEPYTPDWNGAIKKTPQERYDLSKEALTKYMDARDANDYALAHACHLYENQRAADDTKRVLNLTRSGSPSIQRYGAVLWSGDICATWETLRAQIAEGLNMSASGIPYWTMDIGAFFVGSDSCYRKWSGNADKETPWFWCGGYEDGVMDMGYRELYVRWLQWGTFMPIMRSHGTDTPREPWHFGEPGTKHYDTIVKYIKLRYRLLPYVYSMAAMVSRNGYTMMRSLVFDFMDDETATGICDSYMFGPALLVCPVTAPMEYTAESRPIDKPRTRDVYLPKGGWFDFETKVYMQGGGYTAAEAPVEKIPVYVRSGSVIPVSLSGTGEADLLEVYSGAPTSFTLYYDNGTDYAYENGDFAAIKLEWDDKGGELRVTDIEGSYPHPRSLRTVVYQTDGKTREGETILQNE